MSAAPGDANGARLGGTPVTDELVRLVDVARTFDVSPPWLDRVLERKPRVLLKAVDGVSLAIRRGETLGLVGESGCGKSTIARLIVGLYAPTRGRIEYDGVVLAGEGAAPADDAHLRRARRSMQMIFQDPSASLNPRMRVFELLEEGLAALQPETSADERRARIERLTDRVGLRRDALERYPHEFSGGQRQRIAIARALAVDPTLIVCDEPTSALDVSVQAQILNLLRELQRELGVSYLFITHNIGVVEYIADELAVMRAGKLIEQGPALDVLRQPQHEYTRELLAAVPRVVTPELRLTGR